MSEINQGHAAKISWIVEYAVWYEEYSVKAWFQDGSVKIVDPKSVVFKEGVGAMFKPLQDIKYFAQASYDQESETICLLNRADTAPEYRYGNSDNCHVLTGK